MRTRHSYYYVFTYTPIDHSKHGIYYLRRPPFLPYGVQLQYTAPTRHGNRTNRIRPGKPVMSLSFPTLPDSLDARTAFRLPLHLWLGMCIGDLGWGPRTRHLVLYYTRPAVPLGWKSCCKQADRKQGVYTDRI